MRNLAGKPTEEIDRELRRELERCGIAVIEENPIDHPEVKTTIRGALGDLRFTRHWYYWAVNGPVPLEIARRLYEDPVGRTDIRVAGHCGCPAPEGRVSYLAPDGKLLVPESEHAEWGRVFKAQVQVVLEETNSRFSDDLKRDGKPFVLSYHIDSELGLYIFVQTIKNAIAAKESHA